MAKREAKPVGVKLLEGKKIPFTSYSYDPAEKDAVRVAEAVGHDPTQVFKTLVVQPPDADPKSKWTLAVIPAHRQLDLKLLAKEIGAKKVKMATHKEAEKRTGLQVGGISALALLNKGFAVLLDASAQQFDEIVISAGQRGTQVKLPTADFIKLTNGRFAQISK